MSETTVQYQIAITRTGDGASTAAAELKALSTAAAAANTSVNATTPAMNAADNSAKAAGKSFGAMKGALGLIAGQAFPQLTAAIGVAKNAVESMRASNTNLSLSFGTVAAGAAGLAALVATAVTALQEYYATKKLGQAETALNQQERDHQERLSKEIDLLRERNEITNAQARALKDATGDTEGNKRVRSFLRDKNEGNPQQTLSNLSGLRQNADAVDALENPHRLDTETGKIEARAQAQKRYMQDIALSTNLMKEGLLTEQQANEIATQSAITRAQTLVEIRQHLTEIQKMGQQAVESFAGGFSSAFVSFLDGTKSAKEAFTDFARSFLSQMAQMILQQTILNAIKNSSWGGALGFAEGGVRFAANGLAGVSSVSSPTYFPKFNVVAGEAGREMMTVLARPRMMEVGGMQAVVGSAQGNQLAITSASDLAGRGGAGGKIVIQVMGTPDFEARVVQNSVKGAVVQVAQDMRQDTPISRGVKGLTA
jgi:hypothetical protein